MTRCIMCHSTDLKPAIDHDKAVVDGVTYEGDMPVSKCMGCGETYATSEAVAEWEQSSGYGDAVKLKRSEQMPNKGKG